MNYYKRHLGDYAKDTKTLCIYGHGVYTVVLDYYYSEEGPVSDEDVEALVRPKTATERAVVAKVMARYFKRDGDHWRHSYADRVIREWQEKSAKAALSADKRWHSEGNANASPNAERPQSDGNASHKPVAISQEKERGRARELPEDFKPPEFVTVRLRLAGHNGLWKPENVGAFVAHYRSQSAAKTDKEWGELFVKWMLREKAYAPAGSQEPAAPASRPPSCCLCPNPSAGKIGKGDYCAKHLTERQAA